MVEIKGGQKFQRALDEIAQKVSNAAVVQVGFLENARYPDGTSVAMVAAIQEYGAPSRNIPPRPFFRNMIAAESAHWPADVAKLLKAHDFDAAAALGDMGQEISAELQLSINEFTSPGNAPSTIERKGFDHPLIDTGLMRDSVNYRVKENP